MGLLLNLYWLSLGVGGLYILVAGALGAIGGGGHGGGDAAGGHDLGDGGGGASHFDAAGAAGHDAPADLPSADLTDAAAETAGLAGEHSLEVSGGHGHLLAGHHPQSGATDSFAHASPLNLLNLMCFLASFGGTGLALIAGGLPHLLSFPLSLVGGFVVALLFHLFISRVLYRLQGGAAPSQYDMLGLEAEVLTPIESGHLGEIAYTLGGQRFTSPAKLVRGERAGRADSVRIVKVEGNTAYVEPQRKLLE